MIGPWNITNMLFFIHGFQFEKQHLEKGNLAFVMTGVAF